MSEMSILAKPREEKGTATSRRLRRAGWLPGVVYSEGKDARSIQLEEHSFSTALHHHRSENIIVELNLEGEKPCKALLREVQHHPVNGNILHVDFYEISMDKKIRVDVSIELVNEAAGVKEQGGVLEQLLHTIEVECLPTDLVERFELDVSALMIGDRLSVADIGVDPDKFDLLTDGEIAVATVAPPRVEEEPSAEEEEAAEEGAEPEVIGEKAEDEGEKEESSKEG